MNRCVSVMCVLLLAAGVAGASESTRWRRDSPCGRRLPPIQEAQMPGCKEAYSSALPDGVEFSACLTSENAGEVRMRLQRAGALIKEWKTEILPLSALSSERIRMDAIDLTGDGKDEILISTMNAISVGMAVSIWSVWAFDGAKLSEPVVVEDYGVLSFPVCSQDGREKYLLVSRWLPGWEPKRGGGLYLSACWFTLETGGGLFSPAYQRPSVYRRYLFSFEKLRGEAIGRDLPEPWFRSLDTRVVVGPQPCR